MRALILKIKESIASVLPIFIIVLLISFTPLFNLTLTEYIVFTLSTIFLIIGISLFNLGADMAMQPMGNYIGSGLTKSRRIALLIFVVFLLGCFITIAEPDLSVLADQVKTVIPKISLTLGISIGVGVMLIVSVARIVYDKQLSHILMLFYMLCFALTSLITINNKSILIPLAFDSGGVTTGPITVPFIMALGVGISQVIGGRHAKVNSFGLVALSSVGPILLVLILALFSKGSLDYIIPDNYYMGSDLLKKLVSIIFRNLKEVMIAVGLIVVFFLICNFAFLKKPAKKLKRIGIGILYTILGLVMFLTAATFGYMPIGFKMGIEIANDNFYLLIPFGLIVGAVVVFAEPAIKVLTHQVEEITGGYISSKSMLIGLAIGVALSLGLSMIRIIYDFSILYYLVPGYCISLALSLFVPPIYTAIAFDSGGVTSGPMTSSFILSFAIGACTIVQGENAILNDAFGIVALVALAPLITIQLLGFKAIISRYVREHNALRLLLDEDDATVINF